MDVLVLDLDTGEQVAVVDDYASLRWKVEFRGPGDFEMPCGYDLLALVGAGLDEDPPRPRRAVLVDRWPYVVEQVEVTDDGPTVRGRGVSLWTLDRLVEPPPAASHRSYTAVATETVMRDLVHHAVVAHPDADLNVPGLSLAVDLARGPLATVAFRYDVLHDALTEVAVPALMGWEVTGGPAAGWAFAPLEGADRTVSVELSVDVETAQGRRLLRGLPSVTHVVVAGQGEGAARTVVRRDTGASGWAARQRFRDARDVNNAAGNEQAVLEARGDETLTEGAFAEVFEVDAAQSGPVRLGEHYHVGDLVSGADQRLGVARTAQVVAAEFSLAGGGRPDVVVSLDRPWPALGQPGRRSVSSTSRA